MLLPGGTALPARQRPKIAGCGYQTIAACLFQRARASDCGHLRQIASFRHLPIRKPRAQRHQDDSDWDLLVTLPDDAPDGLFDPMRGWQLQRDIGIPATILTVRSTDLAECWDVPNTLGLWWPGKGVCWMCRARTIASDLRLAAENVNDARLLLEIGSRNAAYLASQRRSMSSGPWPPPKTSTSSARMLTGSIRLSGASPIRTLISQP